MVLNFYDKIINLKSNTDEPESCWRFDEQYEGIYAEGAREKEVYFSPINPKNEYIKSDWRYIFKLSRNLKWCPWQFWVEIIAYRLGTLIGVNVPPAHIGFNPHYSQNIDGSFTAVYGALIEWFYDDRSDNYISGGQILSSFIENYDRRKGSQHNLETILPEIDEPKQCENWAKILTFDTLIANTDRHHDNWGRIYSKNENGENINRLSPAFDNGTAMEYSVQEKDFYKYKDKNKLRAYLENAKNARHHMKWSLLDSCPLNYYSFMTKFVLKYPEAKPIINSCLQFERCDVECILLPLCDSVNDDNYRLTRTRLDFMLDMIFHRRRLLEETLGL